ncbi:MAG TPA: response regulator transcription factor [Solirubrobacterales bacterium]|nr:response regulator transcription factor [Solirubrobacterales bacterium]
MLPTVDRLATIVVCEDDPGTRELLCENLEADRFDAVAAGTAEEAMRLCRYGTPDALLLDIGLPDASGLDVIREIRAAAGAAAPFDADLPIVALSGRGSDGDRVRGLRAGADDYLVKPFHYDELLERIRKLLDRRSSRRHGPVRIGLLALDPATREVRVGDRQVELANKEFELLRALAAEPERVFTKEELLRDVWGFESAGRTRTLDSHASRLRRKLDPDRGTYVVNCWGVGYRLVGG